MFTYIDLQSGHKAIFDPPKTVIKHSRQNVCRQVVTTGISMGSKQTGHLGKKNMVKHVVG